MVPPSVAEDGSMIGLKNAVAVDLGRLSTAPITSYWYVLDSF
ncbi:MAG: hypothetical protein SF172_06625 [Burkholderiales bacterium]|jgi:hypothetical protein|nr:hypothetical protein [Burkholderiales bacterium]